MGKLDGKTALVTGASRGIGRAIAKRLAADGARVVVHYGQSHEEAASLLAEIKGGGGEALSVSANITDLAAIDAMFADLATRIDGLDILVNNAGKSPGFPSFFEKMTPEIYDSVFGLNTRGLYFVTQGAVAVMRDGGRVINISSISSKNRLAGQSIYSGSKAAIDAFTRNLSVELAPRKITVNSVQPGIIETGISTNLNPQKIALIASVPLGRAGVTDDVNSVVSFLASDEANWLTGQEILLTGGLL